MNEQELFNDLQDSIKQLEEVGYPMTHSEGLKRIIKAEIVMIKTLIYVVENLVSKGAANE